MEKEAYFTPDGLAQKTQAMLAELAMLGLPGIRRRTERLAQFDPSRAALLVLDMQRYFLQSDSHAWVPSGASILPGLSGLAGKFTEQGLRVVFTRHLNTPENAGSLKTWWRDLLTLDNPLSVISPEFDTSGGVVIHKSQYDAFYGTDLESYLRDHAVTQVVVGGVMTHLCCETTARAAFVRGFEVFFLVDGTATYNERFHLAALLNLAHGFAILASTGEVMP